MTKEQHDQQSAETPLGEELSAAEGRPPGEGGAAGPSVEATADPADSGEGAPADAGSADAASDSTSDSEAAEPDPAELTMLLEDARAKADDAHNQALRMRAEMENMGRRQAKELENAHKFALEGFIKELLQVRDSLELGKAAAESPDADVGKLREGTELTLKLLSDVMTKFGVERIEPEGEPFNPDYHQAMSMQPRSDVPPNTVVNVVQSGYTLNGRLVRPALVMVSQAA
ncbi:MAG: nucleotide exchange factor GrpE [Gammaproteobacteria bacterium]|jgi:molecular chaperone GrpE|nr:nucleotide exchange factor GrpE [Gammaproteobacteria bacterium]